MGTLQSPPQIFTFVVAKIHLFLITTKFFYFFNKLPHDNAQWTNIPTKKTWNENRDNQEKYGYD